MKNLPASKLGCFLGITALFLTCALPAHARKARAIFIQPPDTTLGSVMLYTGKEYVEIELPSRNLSPEVDLPDGELTTFALTARLPAGQSVPAEAPKFVIPENWKRCILLFFPDPSRRPLPVRIIPVNASTTDFPMGHTKIYNVTQSTVAAKFGDEIVKIAPGQTASYKAPVSGYASYPVAIDCQFPGEKDPLAVCRTNWQNEPEARQIMFVTPAPGYKVPRIWGILDKETDRKEEKQ